MMIILVVSLTKKHLDDSVLMWYLYNVIPNFHLIAFTWMNKKISNTNKSKQVKKKKSNEKWKKFFNLAKKKKISIETCFFPQKKIIISIFISHITNSLNSITKIETKKILPIIWNLNFFFIRKERNKTEQEKNWKHGWYIWNVIQFMKHYHYFNDFLFFFWFVSLITFIL